MDIPNIETSEYPIRWRFIWQKLNPPISQVTFAQIRGKKRVGIKEKSLITV